MRLPREDAEDIEPPTADHVEAVCWQLTVEYMLGVLVLDATGVRVGELEAAHDRRPRRGTPRLADQGVRGEDERARWVEIPDDLYEVVLERLPAARTATRPRRCSGVRDRDRLRTAIGRACRDAGVPMFSPHALRHRRISLLHRQGMSWAEIGERMGQRSKLVTADTYTHALIDSARSTGRSCSSVSRCRPRCIPRSAKALLQGRSGLHGPSHGIARGAAVKP